VLWVVAAVLGLRAAPLLVLWVSVVGISVVQAWVQAQAVLVSRRYLLMH
jgi:hypothetical protein